MFSKRLINYIKKYWPFLLILSIGMIWFIFKPNFFANVDEHHYLRTAFKLARGISLEETSEFQSLGGFLNQNGAFISKYNLGNSLWLAPFSLLGVSNVFLASLVGYILSILVSYEIIKDLKARRAILVFVIFNLPLVYFSRTILSEVPAALFFSLSILSFLRFDRSYKYKLLLGLSLGFLTLIRYNFAIWVVILLLGIIFSKSKRELHVGKLIRQLVPTLLTGLPFLLSFLFINKSLYGGFFNSGYVFSSEQGIDFNLIFMRLPQYILYLNVLYPLQLFVFPIMPKSGNLKSDKVKIIKSLLLIFVIILLIFYSVFTGGFLFQGRITDFISGVRFFVPILPIVTIFYFDNIFNFFKAKFNYLIFTKIAVVLSAVILFLGAAYVHFTHNNFISEKYLNFRIINQFACDNPNSLFIGDAEDYISLGEQYDFGECFENNGYVDVSNFQISNLELYFDEFGQIFVLEIHHSTRTDRPTNDLKEFLQNPQVKPHLAPVFTQKESENVKIYQIK